MPRVLLNFQHCGDGGRPFHRGRLRTLIGPTRVGSSRALPWYAFGMCGRYYRIADKQAIVDHFHSPAATNEPFPPGYNIAPCTTQPVIRQGRDTGARELVGMCWGLVGFGSSGPDPKRSTFNARSENLTKSDLWRVPLHKRRCLVPVSGYYEWGARPTKYPSASLYVTSRCMPSLGCGTHGRIRLATGCRASQSSPWTPAPQ